MTSLILIRLFIKISLNCEEMLGRVIVLKTRANKTGTSKVGAISKAKISKVLQLYDFANPAPANEATIASILQAAREACCSVWSSSIWLYRLLVPSTGIQNTKKEL